MKRFLAPIAAALTLVLSLTGGSVAAASSSMSLSASSSSVAKGGYITVYVRENSGSEPVNGAQANFSYPSSLLQYVSISNSSAFSVVAQNSAGGGSVNIGRGALPAVSGSQLIASVTFKALADSGTASFGFTGGSSVVSANSNTDIASSKTGTSIHLIAPTPAAPKDTTPPVITNLAVKNITTVTAVITWTTSEPATSEVNYGFNTAYGLSITNGDLTTSHSMTLHSSFIIPATTYHFIVKSADQAGNSASSPDYTFTTSGIAITALVTDSRTGKPVAGARVSWNDQTAVTNSQGKAALNGLPAGMATIVVRLAGTTYAQTIAVKDGTKPQLIAVKIALAAAGFPLPAAGIAVTVLLVGVVAILTRRRWSHLRHFGVRRSSAKMPPSGAPASATSSPIVSANQKPSTAPLGIHSRIR